MLKMLIFCIGNDFFLGLPIENMDLGRQEVESNLGWRGVKESKTKYFCHFFPQNILTRVEIVIGKNYVAKTSFLSGIYTEDPYENGVGVEVEIMSHRASLHI